MKFSEWINYKINPRHMALGLCHLTSTEDELLALNKLKQIDKLQQKLPFGKSYGLRLN